MSKANSFVIIKGAYLKPAFFFLCFCYFRKDISLVVLNLFISEYLRQISSWKKMKETFPVKFQTENVCFCLR